ARDLGTQANQRRVEAVGEAGFTSSHQRSQTVSVAGRNTIEIIQATQAEVFPYDRNYFRSETGLTESLQRLNHLWQEIRTTQADGNNILRVREAAAMVATARWMYNSALERKETRGMHKHTDYPQQDVNQQHYLISGGLDRVWVKTAPVQQTRVKVEVAA
ncbi:MAG: pyridine nucleotide-disulfide oxidoreductase, partial [Microcoleus sp. SIO2G3]|nr:pyridine nucleotide-disulfide oxidoreductase [Microcoleus sp. SIO2G3]